MSIFQLLRKKKLGLRNYFFCSKNAYTFYHIAMNTLYIFHLYISIQKTINLFPKLLIWIQNHSFETKNSNRETKTFKLNSWFHFIIVYLKNYFMTVHIMYLLVWGKNKLSSAINHNFVILDYAILKFIVKCIIILLYNKYKI